MQLTTPARICLAAVFAVSTTAWLPAREETADTVAVKGKPYVEKVELRGATIHGFETTDVMAKLAGYVSKIHEVNGEQVDIGSVVKAGDILAELHVPELQNELAEKQAALNRAKASVRQAEAAVREAEAEALSMMSEIQAAVAKEKQKLAMKSYREKQLDRITRLFKQGAVGEENQIEAQFAYDAAAAEFVPGTEKKLVYPGVAIAQAHARAAKAKHDRSKADLELAHEDVKLAEATFARTKTLAGYTQITAPFAGIVTSRMVDHGAFVRPPTNSEATPLFTITRVDKVRVSVSVPTSKAGKVIKGQAVVLDNIGGLKGIAVAGKVSRTARVLQKNRMMRIEVDVDNPAVDLHTERKVALRPGLYGSVTVTINDFQALAHVPASALSTDQSGRDFVVVVRGGKRQKQSVRVVFNDAINVGISHGLKNDDVVVKDSSKY